MVRPRAGAIGAAVAITVIAGAASCEPESAASEETAEMPLREAIAALTVADETREGYDRDLFPHWIDADDDDCNTRYEVLIAEATREPDIGEQCRLEDGEWSSYFDGETVSDVGDTEIDHLVPLAEAWDSGAGEWSTGEREEFANDLGDERSLAAVTAVSNRSKSDRDPDEWMPPDDDVACRYVTEWTAVKTRWRLSVDEAEQTALETTAADCKNVTLTVEYAIAPL